MSSVDAALEAGKTRSILPAKPMLDLYILLGGGSGANAGSDHRHLPGIPSRGLSPVAKLALPSGIFQINEPILFGLPIGEPGMFIPSFRFG